MSKSLDLILNFHPDSEMSEQEVYGLEGVESEEEEEEDDFQFDEDDEKDEGEEKESESWGRSKKSYYNADEGSDMEEMLEEEQEAIRLQKKRIEAMDEEDFVDAGWGGVSLEKVCGCRVLWVGIYLRFLTIFFSVRMTTKTGNWSKASTKIWKI
jgi:hypothetical protein